MLWRERSKAMLLGLAVGDAVGMPFEFRSRGSFYATDMEAGGPFKLNLGEWTDDTSMALALADSLLACGGPDPLDQLTRYLRWYRRGDYSVNGRCFDIGNTTRFALEGFEKTALPRASESPRAAGNGSIMRLAPAVMAAGPDVERAIKWSIESSRPTHAAPVCLEACGVLAGTLHALVFTAPPPSALSPKDRLRLLSSVRSAPLHTELLDLPGPGETPPATGYVVDTLRAARWAVAYTESFEEAVLAAVNLGGDTDTTGAVTGQLAGALYGLDALRGIPKHWLSRLAKCEEIAAVAERLVAFGEGT